MSHTIALELSDSLHDLLIKKAKGSGLSPEALIAELIKAAVKDNDKDPLEDFIGAFDSRGLDWAERHDYYIGQSAMNVDDQSRTPQLDG